MLRPALAPVALVYLVCVVGAFVLERQVPASLRAPLMAPLALAFGVHLLVGLVILAARSPRPGARRIGWLFVTIGLSAALYLLCLQVSTLAWLRGMRTPLVTLSDWYLQWGWMGYAWPIAVVLPLLYPTGRVSSPRWRPLAWLALIMGALLWFAAAFGVSVLDGPVPIDNPFAIHAWPWLALWTRRLDSATALLSIATLLSVVFRYRTANAEVRAQVRWLLYLVTLFAAYSLVLLVLNLIGSAGIPQTVSTAIYTLWVVLLGLAVGVAILRYRLYDIDLLIRRTLTYTVVTALLVLLYLGGVLLLQTLLLRLTGGGGEVAIALSTLAIAALFNPLRQRVQGWIDRRFYRGRYHADRIVWAFAQVAQHEADLGRLTGELLQVIQSTVHPTRVGIWLAEEPEREGGRPAPPGD